MKLTRDFIAGSLIIVLSVFLWSVTTTFESDLLGLSQGMPATLMPRLILSVIIILTILMMVQSMIKGGEPIGNLPTWQVPTTAAILGLASIFLPQLGVPLVFFFICLVIPLLWGARNLVTILIFALLVPTAIYITFKLLLGLRFPMGPFAALGL